MDNEWNNGNPDLYSSNCIENEIRLNGLWCDAIIKAGDVEFPVHKVVLCRSIQYFHAMAVNWSEPDRRVFQFDDVTPEIMGLIIDFVYTKNVTLTNDNVFDLMFAADFYNVPSLLSYCSEFIDNHLSLENCISVFQMTNTILAPALQERAFIFICDHFEEVVKSETFLQLNVKELADILGDDGLCVEQESTAFESILKWITHMPDERRDDITTLLSKVRLGLLSLTYLQLTVLTNDVVAANNDSKQMVLNAVQAVSELEGTSSQPGIDHKMTRFPNALLLTTGGGTGIMDASVDDIVSYNYRTDCWFHGPLSKLVHPVAYHGSVILNGHLYIVGGVNKKHKALNDVYRFQFVTHTWNEVAPMHQHRCYLSVTVLNDLIYAIGGFDATAEVYKPETNQWTFIASLNVPRSDASCTTLSNKIYICGGIFWGAELQSAECYDPSTDQWTMIPPMSSPRSGLGVVAYMDKVFAVGGEDRNGDLSSAEAYNPVTNIWRDVPGMSEARRWCGIAVVNKRLFVVGGTDYHSDSSVECYDITTNSWSYRGRLKNKYLIGTSCCVLSGRHMREYCYPREEEWEEDDDGEAKV